MENVDKIRLKETEAEEFSRYTRLGFTASINRVYNIIYSFF